MRWVMHALCVVFVALYLCGCCGTVGGYRTMPPESGASKYPDRSASSMTATMRVPDSTYAVMKVFFATDRTVQSNRPGAVIFGAGRSTEFSYGICEVSIPRDHRMGMLESPSIWRFELRENPEKHVVLLGTVIQDKKTFFSNLKEQVRRSKGRTSFIFIHGYNVSFVEAARRTAQMAYDLGFDGAPVFYSWPSRGEPTAYLADEQMIEWAQPNLRAFLEDYVTKSDADDIYVIAHSMGNRALTRAVSSLLSDRPELRPKIKAIILAAPDIDAEVFRRDIVPAMTRSGRPITLYASSEDKALMLSERLHAYPRAGDAGAGLVIVPGIETVDASKVATGLIGHSYFGDTRSILSDIFNIIRNGKSARDRFGLVEKQGQAGSYWIFNP